jgi:hypothetical protein
MKRIISTLALAAPLATVALSLGATPAMAQPADPPLGEIKAAELAPDIPEDELPQPEDPELPDDGPPIIKNPDPCPTHGSCGDDPGDKDEDEPGDGDDFDKPNRIDAGSGETDEGMQLAWLIAGGGLVTATGAAYAVRSRARTRA